LLNFLYPSSVWIPGCYFCPTLLFCRSPVNDRCSLRSSVSLRFLYLLPSEPGTVVDHRLTIHYPSVFHSWYLVSSIRIFLLFSRTPLPNTDGIFRRSCRPIINPGRLSLFTLYVTPRLTLCLSPRLLPYPRTAAFSVSFFAVGHLSAPYHNSLLSWNLEAPNLPSIRPCNNSWCVALRSAPNKPFYFLSLLLERACLQGVPPVFSGSLFAAKHFSR